MMISRRCFLGRSAVLVAGVSLASVIATSAEAKVAQKLVGYQDSPKGNQSCENCKLFIAPDACKSVDGAVSPSGWCKMWLKA